MKYKTKRSVNSQLRSSEDWKKYFDSLSLSSVWKLVLQVQTIEILLRSRKKFILYADIF